MIEPEEFESKIPYISDRVKVNDLEDILYSYIVNGEDPDSLLTKIQLICKKYNL